MRCTAFVAAVAVFVGAAATVGCVGPSSGSSDGEAAGELVLSQASAARLAGSFDDGGAELAFEARPLGGRGAVVAVDVGGGRLELRVDEAATRYDVEGHDTVLGAEDGRALKALSGALAAALGARGRELAAHEAALIAIASYWGESPAGYAHGARSIVAPEAGGLNAAPLSLDNDGISCVRRGQSYPVIYDDESELIATIELVTAGSNWGYNPVNDGDYSCMGRCGGGCSGFSFYGRYTRDCLEHDACSYWYSSSGGGGDPNCGDEYANALDDFLLPGWYGCGG